MKPGGTRRSKKTQATAKKTPTGKEAVFVQEYLLDLNAARAAEAAGYAPGSARQTGYRLLTKDYIQDAIAHAKALRAERVEITQDRVLQEIAHNAFADIRNLIEVDGQGRVCVRDLSTLPESVTRSVESITQTSTERFDPENGNTVEKIRLAVKLNSKTANLRMLMDHLGMDAPKNHNINVGDVVLEYLKGLDLPRGMLETVVDQILAKAEAESGGER